MDKFLSEELWSHLRSTAAASEVRHFAVAYVTDEAALPMSAGDTLVVDASDAAIVTGKTRAAAVQDLFNKGVKIFSLQHLHAKVYVCGSFAIVGSANLSTNSQERLHEAAILSSDRTLVRQAASRVAEFALQGKRVDPAFLDRIKDIKVAQSNDPGVGLYRLAETPGGRLLRAYFVALIQLQLENIRPNVPFRLWPDGNFGTHLRDGRLQKSGKEFIFPSQQKIEYFTTGKGAPDPAYLHCFLRALRTGEKSHLPEELEAKKLIPFD
ncbi:phospholipase D family protein [Variovorax sp. LjRoot178]|uniref:phospholipase D family protein n=1 Tax=Variovorax sp. LjRoot178 TaxID=3342277 RepID=UPI003ECFA4B2